ncbi:MAG TPA: K(+)-transporting ATPase subunit C [Chitinophagales bacterium]|nr:K(+)-transporting ATPase subunit C [Chitinophagales bacterium]
MKTYILPSIRLTLVCLVFFAGFYPLVLWGIAKAAGPGHGEGEVLKANGKVVGYALVGQSFTKDKYFNGRPSAVGYNAASSGASNKGPSNPDYLKQVQQAIDTFAAHNPTVKREDIPAELVTASGSGLDPDISPAAALVQIPRIAKVRDIDESKLKSLVETQIEKPLLGLFGTERINVLKLNIELDQIK